MADINFTTIDRVFSKLYREIGDTKTNEADIIEWVGEAIDAMRMPSLSEQKAVFLKVSDFETKVPRGFQSLLQLARYNGPVKKIEPTCAEDVYSGCTECIECNDCEGLLPATVPAQQYTDCGTKPITLPVFVGRDQKWMYSPLIATRFYKQNFTPIRLSNNVFFNTLVCKEIDQSPYSPDICRDEYTIVGNMEKVLRFSFKEGYVVLSYLKTAVDDATGYPLIPDGYSYQQAITYYVKWKIFERMMCDNREGAQNNAINFERLWLKYYGMAVAETMMPEGADDWQDILEQTHHIIPQYKLYNNFFGDLGKEEMRNWGDPRGQNHNGYGRRW